MRKLFVFLVLFALFLVSIVPAFAQERPDLVELLENDSSGRFTTLVAAIDAAGLRETLTGEGPFTLLAPTNDAFAAAFEAMGITAEDALADTETLTQILTYHVIPGQYFFRNLTSGPTLDTAEGEPVTFDLTGGVFTAQGVNISDPDNVAANGVMHVADGVLLPPSLQAEPAAEPTEEATEAPVVEAPTRPNLVEVLEADGRFSTLLAALTATGLSDTLTGEGPFTLLAPTNDAIAASLETLGMSQADLVGNPEALSNILLYHVIPGRYFFRNLTSGPTLDTAEGEPVTFDLTGGVFTVQGVNISDPDNVAANGVMHVVDGILIPPSMQAEATPEPTAEPTAEPTEVATEAPVVEAPPRPNLVEVLEADDRFTTLVAAIDAAGLRDVLSQGGPFTLLAPTNDAFAAAFEAMGISAEDALADTTTLNDILLYHVIPGRYFFRNLTGGPTLATLEGQDVTFDLTGGVFTVEGVNISDPDNVAANGVMHVADGVLLPPDLRAVATPEPTAEPTEEVTEAPVVEAPTRPNLVEVLEADGRFSTLLAALTATGLSDTLTGEGPFTLLAPTDDAIAASLETLGMSQADLVGNPEMLTKILRYHVIPGQYFFRNLTSGPTLDTLEGEAVTFDLTGGVFTAGGVNISDPDNIASNGVMHVADGVLLPPSLAATLSDNPRVRVVNLARIGDIGTISLFVNGELSELTHLENLYLSDWMVWSPGTYDVGIAPEGGEPVINASANLSEGDWVTLAVTGAGDSLIVTPLFEDFSPLAEGQARLGVFNGVEGSPNYAVVVDGVTVIVRLGYPGTLGDNDGYYAIDLPAGAHTIRVVVDGNPSEVVFQLDDIFIGEGSNMLLMAHASTGTPGWLIGLPADTLVPTG